MVPDNGFVYGEDANPKARKPKSTIAIIIVSGLLSLIFGSAAFVLFTFAFTLLNMESGLAFSAFVGLAFGLGTLFFVVKAMKRRLW